MKYDLVVIGGGYWGTAIAYEGRAKGWTTLLIDSCDTLAGSRNSSAVCDPAAYKSNIFQKYWPTGWQPSELEESLNWLVSVGGGRLVREAFWNLFQGTDPRAGSAAIYLDDNTQLERLHPREAGTVHRGEKRAGGWVLHSSLGELQTTRIAVAAGTNTDNVLGSLSLPKIGVESLAGRGIILRGTPRVEVPVSVMIRPYTKHTIRDWKGAWRVGDTAEPGDTLNDKKLEDLRKVVKAVMPGATEIKTVVGYRPVMAQFTVDKLAPGVVVATGGHRLGLGLSGLVASRSLSCFR